MQTHKLTSEYRETSGKGAARRLRADGRIPAILYGQDEESISIWIKEPDLRRILVTQWETAMLDLTVRGKVKKECNALIKYVQQHPTTGKVLHIDFLVIHRGQKLRLDVPLSVVGDPLGVKEMGGILEHGVREAAIRCLPRHIPENIEIDVSELGIHDALHIRDLIESHPDLEFLDEPDLTIAIVLPPKLEAEPVAEEEIEGDEEPEVIAKGKEEESAGEDKKDDE